VKKTVTLVFSRVEKCELGSKTITGFAVDIDGVKPYISLGIKNVEFNAPTICIFFPVHQQQAETSGGGGSSFQNHGQYRADSQWGTGSLTAMQDREENDHQLISAGDDYGNSETLVAGNAPGQQAFSYWDVSASVTEVREFRFLHTPVCMESSE
jgi:hypothetical protein